MLDLAALPAWRSMIGGTASPRLAFLQITFQLTDHDGFNLAMKAFLNEHQRRTSVAIIEDNLNFLEKFVNIVAGMPDFSVSGVATTGKAGLELIERSPAKIYLIDLGLPDMNGIHLIARTLEADPTSCVMVVTVFADEASIVACIEAGATGYLLKDSSPAEVMECIRNLRDGGVAISPKIARTILQRVRLNYEAEMATTASLASSANEAPNEAPHPIESLTTREMEILRLLATGLSFNDMGTRIFISPHTVAKHIKNIYHKLTVNSRGEAVYAALQYGLLNRDSKPAGLHSGNRQPHPSKRHRVQI